MLQHTFELFEELRSHQAIQRAVITRERDLSSAARNHRTFDTTGTSESRPRRSMPPAEA